MKDPLELAIQKISETRNLLQLVVTSSESFDYPKAKLALQELQRKVKELDRVQRDLAAQRQNAGFIEFPIIQKLN